MSHGKKILVTGGAGYIGSLTIISLIEKGYTPIILDNFSNSYPESLKWINNLIGSEQIFYDVDCRNYEDLKKIFTDHTDISGVIHFAAYKAVGESVQNPLKYFDNNIGSLITLLRVMEECHVHNLVFSSSCTVYGIPQGSVQVTESSDIREPFSPYGRTKIICEEIIKDTVKSTSVRSVILRYFNPIGAHPSGKIGELPIGKPNNLVPFITQTAIGIRNKLTIFGNDYKTEDGTNVRDYIHVYDLADSHVMSLNYLDSEDQNLEIFNVGTGKGSSVLQVVKTFEKATGVSLNYDFGKKREGDVPEIYANSDKIKKILRWQPKYNLSDALKHAWSWQKYLEEINFNIKI